MTYFDRRIYCRKFLLLSNQTSRYKLKCIRIKDDTLFGSKGTADAFIESVIDLVTGVDTALSDVDEVLATEVDDRLKELDTEDNR